MSSGNRKVHRLSLRGNRRINHAIHMAAITQISHKHSPGRAYYDKKIAEGRTHKDALRSLKRRISDAIYARLQADARQAAKASEKGPGGQPGNDSDSSAAWLTPRTPALRTSHSRTRDHHTARLHGGHTAEGDFEENTASRLTPTAKRTRSDRMGGRDSCLRTLTRMG